MDQQKAWIWFKGGLKGGYWAEGFTAIKSEEGGYLIEKSDFKKCRLPDWRVALIEPKNKTEPPEIPKESIWKFD